ncbi:MAG TPA: tRNA dihydrouridine synthase DusB [Firmicutes bacterium]|nr:tRNA dihydrouridine synthase DusB [Bacillota bacterium]
MGVFLAPMAGVTDLPFRLIAKEYGADLVVTEMISAQALVYSNRKTLRMLAIEPAERPVSVQLFGHDPHTMARAAGLVCEYAGPDMIDLNFGCPTPKIVKNGDGAALLKDPHLLADIAAAVAKAVSVPVTAKIRLGWDEKSINCIEVAQRLADAGMHWVTVHGRTREQFYGGAADWNWIARVKEAVDIPVVGNGDVFSATAAERLLKLTQCDHLAVGRGARGNPWIFRQIKARLRENIWLPEPTTAERVALALRHLRLKTEQDGEERAVREMRPHLMWYLKGVPGSSRLRREINTACCVREVENILNSLVAPT